jgi:hypothetical protein
MAAAIAFFLTLRKIVWEPGSGRRSEGWRVNPNPEAGIQPTNIRGLR